MQGRGVRTAPGRGIVRRHHLIEAWPSGSAWRSSEDAQLWALGPESGGRTLTTAVVPDLTPRRNGNPFSLSALHGRKVLLVAWASW